MRFKLPGIIFVLLFFLITVGISPPFLFSLLEKPERGSDPVRVVRAANSQDVVINEIAWMGTRASHNDEWVELYNNSDSEIDLSGWTLSTEDGTPNITLDETISGADFFLLERTDDTTVSDLDADNIYTGALSNNGESLELRDAEDNLIDRVNASEGWFAGDNNSKATMERVDPEASGSAKLNWNTSDGKTINGKDAEGNPIMGTPKAQNSVYGKPPEEEESEEKVEINFDLPASAVAGESFAVEVSAKNLDSSSDYWAKFLAAPKGGKFYDGRTLGADGKTYRAWNASWEGAPKFKTKSDGNAEFGLYALVDEDAVAGDYEAKIRVRKVGSEKNIDSEIKSLEVKEAKFFEGTISKIKNLDLGTKVKVRGFVTAPPVIFGDDIFYIRDSSAGIRVSFSEAKDYDLELGDEVELGCGIEESYDELYIKMDEDSDLRILRTDLDEPEPEEVETGAVGEDLEGQLVKLSGEVVETSGSTFWIDDGSGRVKIYVKDSTDIEVTDKRVGYYTEVVGIVSQWGELEDGSPNYRVMPRFQDDLEITEPERPAEEATGVALGLTPLPTTGPTRELSAFLGKVFLCLGLALRLLIFAER